MATSILLQLFKSLDVALQLAPIDGRSLIVGLSTVGLIKNPQLGVLSHFVKCLDEWCHDLLG